MTTTPSIGIPVKEVRKKYEKKYIDGWQRARARGENKFDDTFYIQMKHYFRNIDGKRTRLPFPYERESCPTPGYDETVYKIFPKEDKIDLLWTLPSQQDCLMYYHNKHLVRPEEYCLLQYILDYYDGKLFQLVDRMEHEDGRYVQ